MALAIFQSFRVHEPPNHIKDDAARLRWKAISTLRGRALYWWSASVCLKTVDWMLRVATVIAAAVTAGRPHMIADWTNPNTLSNWTTLVAVLSGVSTLVPWRKAGEDFSKAYEAISDGIMQYDASPGFPLENVLIAAREAGQVIPTYREWDQVDHDAGALRRSAPRRPAPAGATTSETKTGGET